MMFQSPALNGKKVGSPPIFRKFNIFLLCICFSATGCALVELRKEVNESLESTILVGHVQAPPSVAGPIIVAAYAMNQGRREVAHHTVLHDSGEFELMVGKGEYHVFAYRDKDGDLILEAGEPAGQYAGLVSAPAGGVVSGIDFAIPEAGGNGDLPDGFEISPVNPGKPHSRLAGTVVDLDDDLFREENGSRGFWEPTSFYKEIGGNIYFLEEYDPRKIPVLFIHGATGTPKGWKYFAERIDRTRFQPWFFYYPSGARIGSMSYLLLWKLSNLQIKYGFDKMYITAHSMGGLLARSFLVDYGKYFPYVRLFVSLATPWGGDKMAEYGVKQSPAVIPCWIDMQPESEFIKSLYREKLPETIGFYLFYGYRGNRNPFRTNNDGTITLSSLLDRRSQSEAKMNIAFDEDHAGIAFSKEVFDQYNAILNAADDTASSPRTGGYLKLRLSYTDSSGGARPWPSLILRSAGRKDSETTINLSPDDTDKLLGPFPPGEYSASIIALAAKPDKQLVPVSIESGKTARVDFEFSPDGMICGRAASAPNPEDRPAGMPSDRYLPPDRKIDIQSVELKGGPGVRRILRPLKGETVDYNEYTVSRKDFCHNGYFYFFDLPAGDYELTIKAGGHRDFVKNQTVIPGRQKDFRVTELTPVN